MNTTPQRLDQGERAPDFVLPCQNGTPTRFYAKVGGKPTVLLFYDADDVNRLLRFSEILNDYASGSVSIFVVKRDNPAVNRQRSTEREMLSPVFVDTKGEVRTAYRLGIDEKNVLFVLSPNLRVLASLPLKDEASTAHKTISILDAALPQVDPEEIKAHAPVLLIPDVLAPGICQELIHAWETQGHTATGVESSRRDQREDIISLDHKQRHDHTIRDENLLRRLSSWIGRRVMPEIHKAFAFRATRFEGFKIACYDATAGGFFHPHRDNLSPSTAHRRFALSLNLNGGYYGGYLRFPEYGPHLYRPDAGDALVFSCSHLHEATAVTKGRRFVLLSFLYGAGEVRHTHQHEA